MTENVFAMNVAFSIALFQEEGDLGRRGGLLGQAGGLANGRKRSEFTETWTVVLLRFASVLILMTIIIIGKKEKTA